MSFHGGNADVSGGDLHIEKERSPIFPTLTPDSVMPPSTSLSFDSNLAVHTNPSHDLKIVSTSVPEPKEGEVIVHVKATGICGRSFPQKSSLQQ